VTSALLDCALFGGSSNLDNMLNFVQKYSPYMLLTKDKIDF